MKYYFRASCYGCHRVYYFDMNTGYFKCVAASYPNNNEWSEIGRFSTCRNFMYTRDWKYDIILNDEVFLELL